MSAHLGTLCIEGLNNFYKSDFFETPLCVVPRSILLLLNRYGCPNIEPKFFTVFVRRHGPGWKVYLKYIYILQILKFSGRLPDSGSVLLKHSVDIGTRMPQKILGKTPPLLVGCWW